MVDHSFKVVRNGFRPSSSKTILSQTHSTHSTPRALAAQAWVLQPEKLCQARDRVPRASASAWGGGGGFALAGVRGLWSFPPRFWLAGCFVRLSCIAHFFGPNQIGSKPMGYHFGVGEFTTHSRFEWLDWDVHWDGLLTRGLM